ncbi:MAG: hypothetical protein QOE75_1296, partial [Solirubrobacterales bacterium]|nr:hypothetical protein [Solirubrobacterales bacterium]
PREAGEDEDDEEGAGGGTLSAVA